MPDALKPCFHHETDLRANLPANSRHLLTDEPREACVFWVEITQGREQKKGGVCPFARIRELPHWFIASPTGSPDNGGMNHVVYDNQDNTYTPQLRRRFLGKAALAVVPSTTARFVSGLDIAIGLRSMINNPQAVSALFATPSNLRKHVITFKGSMSRSSRLKVALQHDESAGVIALVAPEGVHDCRTEQPKKKFQLDAVRRVSNSSLEDRAMAAGVSLHYAKCCAQLLRSYDQHDYMDVLNTTFALVIGGHAVQSFRLTEALSVGAIPVFVGAEEFFVAYGHGPSWNEAALFVPVDVNIHRDLMPVLHRIMRNITRLTDMQAKAKRIFEEWFQGDDEQPIRASALEVLRRRFEFESDE